MLAFSLESNADGTHSSRRWRANNFDDCLNKFKGVAVKVCNYEVFMMFNARRLKMNRSAFSALFVAAALAGNPHNATAQMINPTVQTTSPRVVASRSAPATAAKPGATVRVMPQIGPRPTGLNPQRFNADLPRTIAQLARDLRAQARRMAELTAHSRQRRRRPARVCKR